MSRIEPSAGYSDEVTLKMAREGAHISPTTMVAIASNNGSAKPRLLDAIRQMDINLSKVGITIDASEKISQVNAIREDLRKAEAAIASSNSISEKLGVQVGEYKRGVIPRPDIPRIDPQVVADFNRAMDTARAAFSKAAQGMVDAMANVQVPQVSTSQMVIESYRRPKPVYILAANMSMACFYAELFNMGAKEWIFVDSPDQLRGINDMVVYLCGDYMRHPSSGRIGYELNYSRPKRVIRIESLHEGRPR